jgi:hypothetical protein
MTTSTITWTQVAEGLPDVEFNVLLGLSSGFTCEGFLDVDHEGAQVWRDVCAIEIEDAVVAWAELPTFDSHADSPQQPAIASPEIAAPMRAFRLTLKLEADDRRGMASALINMAHQIEREELTIGVSGGVQSGAIYELLTDTSQTHQNYFKQVQEYLRQKKSRESATKDQ